MSSPVIRSGGSTDRQSPEGRRTNPQVHEEDQDQDQAPPEVRKRAGRKRVDPGDPGGDAARTSRCQGSHRQEHQEAQQERERDQFESRREPVHDVGSHRLGRDEGASEITVQQVDHVALVLHVDRLVETQIYPLLFDLFGRSCRTGE